jgi:hypothetical protein
MQPQQPYSQPPQPPVPENAGQYDFIVNNGTPANRPNPKTMFLFIGGTVVLVIALVWFILSLFLGGNSGSSAPLVTIAQEQTEIARIATAAAQSNHLTSQDTRNFTRNTQLTISSDNTDLLALLKTDGKKLDEKQLGLKRSATTDSTLEAANSSGTYDSTLTGILQTQLKAYQTSIKQAYATSTSNKEKSLLNSEYDHATLLLEQSTQRN